MSNSVVFTLLEAKVALYRLDAEGQPLLAYPVWRLSSAERLQMVQTPIEVETWPTGRENPHVRLTGMRHDIDIGRVWELNRSQPLDLPLDLDGRYVLVIGWTEEGKRPVWHSKTYYGVTEKRREIDQRAERGALKPDNGFHFRAESMVPNGGAGIFNFPEPTLPPLYVQWVNGSESLRLFEYNPTTKTFSESQTGLATGRASIGNAPFNVQIQSTQAWWVADGVLTCHDLVEDAGIAPSEKPRLEFWRGTRRLATVGKAGLVRVFELTEATPSASASKFQFLAAGSTLAATLGEEGLTANSIAEI
ncbi:MAG TPA: hypothetical protein VGH19_06700 [Verrucomicrobiae bacterium]